MTATNAPAGTLPPLRFERSSEFHRAVSARVHRHLDASRVRRRDVPAFYVKAALLIAWTVASYVLLVWFADGVVEGFLYTVSLGLSSILLAFNIYHDASHNAASRHRAVNRAGQLLMDLSGSSSYVWRQRHNRIHHLYPNVHGYDGDIDVAVARLGPHQKYRWFYRFQHLYLWPLSGFYSQQWQFVDDVVPVFTGRVGGHRFIRPRGWDLVQYVGGKLAFLGLAFGLPLSLHSWWSVVAAYFVVSYINGITFMLAVQLSHVVEEAAAPLPPADGLSLDWAEHQVRVSCDFGRDNPVLGWLFGGLNFQIEHHLFPRLCHVHYPYIAPVVEATCRDFGIPYHAHAGVAAGLRSHFRHLQGLAVRPGGVDSRQSAPSR